MVAVEPATISGLFNTGVDASGNAVAGGDGALAIHYTVSSLNISGGVAGVDTVTYKHPSYVADSTTSRWISHSSSSFPSSGITTFRTTFDLTGFDPTTTLISGLNAVDNAGVIVLNGHDTGVALNGSFGTLVALALCVASAPECSVMRAGLD